MTDYVKSTNFTSKDSLASGNPLKIIKGTEFDTEFNNIATAVATKADLNDPAFIGVPTAPTATAGTNTAQVATTAFVTAANTVVSAVVATKANIASPTFTGVPAAPTASSGTNTTQLATTAFVTAALQAVYPVGSIYINAGVSTNPNTLLGFGTWTAFGAGRVMVGLNGSDALFDALEETGGSKDAVVVSHTHTATVTDPGHFHTQFGSEAAGVAFGSAGDIRAEGSNPNTGTSTTGITVSNASTGSSGTNANLQPYITVAMWKRTA